MFTDAVITRFGYGIPFFVVVVLVGVDMVTTLWTRGPPMHLLLFAAELHACQRTLQYLDAEPSVRREDRHVDT